MPIYAVIKTGGKQYRVAPGDVVKGEKLGIVLGAPANADLADAGAQNSPRVAEDTPPKKTRPAPTPAPGSPPSGPGPRRPGQERGRRAGARPTAVNDFGAGDGCAGNDKPYGAACK